MTEVEKPADAVPEAAPPARDWLSRWLEDWPPPRWWAEMWRGRFPDVEPLRIEEYRDGDTLVVRAEMPGLDPDKDVTIDVVDGSLRIRAERRQESRTEERGGYRSEFRYGSFSRTLPLPAGARRDDIVATYTDGILEVRIPVEEGTAGPRTIPVTRS